MFSACQVKPLVPQSTFDNRVYVRQEKGIERPFYATGVHLPLLEVHGCDAICAGAKVSAVYFRNEVTHRVTRVSLTDRPLQFINRISSHWDQCDVEPGNVPVTLDGHPYQLVLSGWLHRDKGIVIVPASTVRMVNGLIYSLYGYDLEVSGVFRARAEMVEQPSHQEGLVCG